MRRANLTPIAFSLAFALASLPACSTLLGFEDLAPAEADAGAAGPDAGEDVGPDVGEDAPDAGQDADTQDATDAAEDTAADVVEEGETGAEAGCGDTTSSQENCGRCGHDCLKGECVQGMCQPFTLAKISDGAWGMALDDTRLYIAGQLNNEIVRVDKVTGAVQSTDTANDILVPTWIAVGATSMVWSNRVSNTGSVASCPVTGCGGNPPTLIVPVANRPNGVLVDGDTLYWAESYAGTVSSAKVSDGSSVQVLVPASLGFQPFRMVLHGGYIYFTEVAGGHVVRVPEGGGAAVTLGTSASPTGIAVTSDKVYWADSQDISGRIISVPNADPPDGGVVTTDVAWQQDHAYSVAVDADNVYWVASAGWTTAAGAVRMCPLSGCPGTGPITLASQLPYPIDLAVDDKAIYVTIFGVNSAVDGAVLRIAKP